MNLKSSEPYHLKQNALLIDHDDSFIWNIKSWLDSQFFVEIINYKELIIKKENEYSEYNLIILSPGPKHPADYTKSLQFLQILPLNKNVLGICLGWQMMVLSEKGSVHQYSPPVHGKISTLNSEIALFHQLKVARYHSLTTKPSNDFQVLATSSDDQQIMWGKHKKRKWIGFQFYPESFLTESKHLYLDYLIQWMKS